MRWNQLFDDLAGQGAAAQAAELAAEVADRGRHAAAQATLADRLRAWPAAFPLEVGLPAGLRASGRLVAVGSDWIAVLERRAEWLVPLASIRWLRTAAPLAVPAAGGSAAPEGPGHAGVPAGSASGPAAGEVLSRTPLAQAVRFLVRDRSAVRVALRDGVSLCGTIDQAASDHLALAQHPLDEPRRDSGVLARCLVAYSAVAAVHGGQVWSAS